MMKKKILIFGAGKIGRSFIGQLFSQAGYRVVFIDIDRRLVDLLNESGCYTVVFCDSRYPERERKITVQGIRALHLSEKELILDELETSDLVATSVGKRGLADVASLLAQGIRRRSIAGAGALDIILAENARDAAFLMLNELKFSLPDLPVEELAGLVETSVGKMVPIHTVQQLKEDPLAVRSEPYNSLIVDAKGFRNSLPDVSGLEPKENIRAWVDRKLFIHNLGHASLAYHAYALRPDLKYTWQALEDEEIHSLTRRTMMQAAAVLIAMYPSEFNLSVLAVHADELLERFSNRDLGDTIFRVGCDLPRKLNRDDRLMVPVLSGIAREMDVSMILLAWIRGCSFEAADEQGNMHPADTKFKETFKGDPLLVLRELCNFDPPEHPELFEMTRNMLSRMA